ncbi:MAG: anhydro-N-acetylmuramic acid kinase [Flavisolibacter sp.]
MLYRALGLMSGSSLDGLDLVFAEFHHTGGKWTYEILAADCYDYTDAWRQKLRDAVEFSARDYQLLHTEYGHYLGQQVNRFIEENELHYKVGLIASHGHTTFHLPAQKMTAQLGDGAALAAETRLPVVSDLRALDVAFGGQGAPIVPIGEKLLLPEYSLFLNIGGIANLSFNLADSYTAFDVCPANRVLNMLAQDAGQPFDSGGQMAAAGRVQAELLQQLNALPYYRQAFPKSLANDFGTASLYPLIKSFNLSPDDSLRTMVEHVVQQIGLAVKNHTSFQQQRRENDRLLVTGGGALNDFLVNRLTEEMWTQDVEVVVPDEKLVQYKEALIMAFIGVLRWRQEYNVLSTVTGAERSSIGGALWMGGEA